MPSTSRPGWVQGCAGDTPMLCLSPGNGVGDGASVSLGTVVGFPAARQGDSIKCLVLGENGAPQASLPHFSAGPGTEEWFGR